MPLRTYYFVVEMQGKKYKLNLIFYVTLLHCNRRIMGIKGIYKDKLLLHGNDEG